MNPLQTPAIRAASLVKNYSTDWRGRRWPALAGVDLTVARGTVCGLIGPNGSGKSTTLKILAGLVRPDSGRAEIDGVEAADAIGRGRVGYLPETPAWPGFLSGLALLAHLARLSGLTASAARDAAYRALDATGLSAAAARRISGYSKGMRQRLGIAQAMLTSPPVLLLDEPASGLDPRATAELGRIIREVSDLGRTVLLTSHFLPQVEELCDAVVMLDCGRVLFAGLRGDVAAAGGLHRVYLERTAP